MYVIEDSNHNLIQDGRGREILTRLSVIHRPDGGQTTNQKVDEPLFDEDGREFTIRELTEPVEEVDGGGPRALGRGPVEYVDGVWRQTRKMGPALPDPQGGDPKADGYDPQYADNYGGYRRSAYEAAGATLEALMVAAWEASMQAEPDNAERDRINEIREAVKARFPKPA